MNFTSRNKSPSVASSRTARISALTLLLLLGVSGFASSSASVSPAKSATPPAMGEAGDRVALDQVVGVALSDPAVQSSSTNEGFSAWVTLELRIERPEKWRGKTLRLVCSEDLPVKSGDRVEVDLRHTTVSRLPKGILEAPLPSPKQIKVIRP